MDFPKIKLGTSKKPKNHFPLPIDSNTSADWGFVQPLCKVPLIPASDINIQLNSFVRLSAMNVPTFGRVEYRTYHRFVPIADLWQPFECMLTGKPYYTSAFNGIPSSVPVVRLCDLSEFLLCQFPNIFTVYSAPITDSETSLGTNYEPVTNQTTLASAVSSFNQHKSHLGIQLDTHYCTNQNDLPGRAFSGDKQINPNNADFVMFFALDSSTSLMFCWRFCQSARNLRKVLLGLGYQIDMNSLEELSLLPLFAYFKAYFDLFAPQRDITWTSTNAYKVLDYYRENFNKTIYGTATTNLGNAQSDLSNFIFDLSECYYTEDPNFVSAHIAQPALTLSSGAPSVSKANEMAMATDIYNNAGKQPFITQVGSNNPLTAMRIKMLQVLTPYVNKHSVAGGKIADLLKSILGADYIQDDRSYHIGSNVLQCQISDVYSTTENSDVALGEYAGKGIGFDKGQKMQYHTSTYGYYIALGVIVPNSNFAQSVDPCLKHRSRYEFYHPDFDALGFQITQKDAVFGSNDISIGSDAGSDSFGYIPRYSEYKTAFNILNGMLSLRSSRDSYLPYTLDKYITPVNVVGIPVDSNGHEEGEEGYSGTVAKYKLKYARHDVPIASTAWRYIGKYNWIGNFNRIFNNEGYEDASYLRSRGNNLTAAELLQYDPIDDNFIIHNVFDIHVNAPMLSLADSFDTDSFDSNAISTEKA